MCVICLLINKSIPTPRSLANSLNELNTKEEHIDDILDEISEKMPENEFASYLNDFKSELYFNFLRNT